VYISQKLLQLYPHDILVFIGCDIVLQKFFDYVFAFGCLWHGGYKPLKNRSPEKKSTFVYLRNWELVYEKTHVKCQERDKVVLSQIANDHLRPTQLQCVPLQCLVNIHTNHILTPWKPVATIHDHYKIYYSKSKSFHQ